LARAFEDGEFGEASEFPGLAPAVELGELVGAEEPEEAARGHAAWRWRRVSTE